MTTVEAAQKWAEAKDVLESALGALRAATAAYDAAYAAEREAWEALETLAGREPARIVEPEPQPQLQVWRAVPRVPGIG